MKKPLKVLVLIAAIVALLMVVLVILTKILVTPDRVKAVVLPRAEEALHRKIDLGEIRVGLFSGIVLRDLTVHEVEGTEPFVAAREVVLRYRLWPLFLGRVMIDEVRLEAPRIRVVRLADGSFNFSDLIPAADTGVAKPGTEGEDKEPIDLLVSDFIITGGEAVFLDHRVSPQAPYRTTLSGLDLSASGISLLKPFPFEMTAQINGAPLAVRGEASPLTREGKAAVILSGLNVTAFTPYFGDKFPGKVGAGTLALDLTAEGGAGVVRSSGKVSLNGLDLTLDALREAPFDGANLSLEYDLRADLESSRIELEQTILTFNGIPVLAAGRVENFRQQPSVDLEIRIADLDLRAALAALPPKLLKDADGLDPAGKLSARISLKGPTAEPKKLLRDGEVRLEEVVVNAGGFRPALNGDLRLVEETLASENLTLRLGDNRADLVLKAENLMGRPVVVSTRLTAERFDLAPLLATAGAPAAGGGREETPSPKPAGEPGPLDLPLKAEGSVRVGEALYQGLSITDFDLLYRLEQNVLTVEQVTGKVANGTFRQTARVDLRQKGFVYSTSVLLDGVQADPVVTAFWPQAAGTTFGTLRLKTDLAGRGASAATAKQNLSGTGELLITDGKLTGAGVVRGLADFLNLEELRVMSFSRLNGSFTIRDGKLNLNSDLTGENLSMSPRGTVGLDGSLDVSLDLRLSPALSRKLDSQGKVASFLSDAEGRSQLPLKVGGTVGKPVIALDASTVKTKVKEKAVEEVQKKILEKLGPKDEEEKTPAKKQMEDTLKQLLGR